MHNRELPMKSEFLLYQSKDGTTKLQTRIYHESVWLSLKELAELFGIDKSGISRHLKNIFESGELSRSSVVALFAITATDGKTYQVEHYNLDAIISVGYRVNSIIGTHFRQWATHRLREYIVKGFVLDDERLKGNNTYADYFDELLARIRDIRASEKRAYLRVREIFAMAVDYDPASYAARTFYAAMQNKVLFQTEWEMIE